ncbi:MAG: glycoside hydrolase family 3 C-terminal domain-containing protein [Anaerolineae bacterium]|nr:glycoside hydrolase family 3 C-terminal domain-containing protein [Anaerolineae bacterium]
MSEMPKYKDVALPIAERVADLVARMTLEEKISQLIYDAPAIERLDVPAYNWWNECLHGVGRAGVATVFPQAIGLAATWDPDLLHRVATVISNEARAKHHEALRLGIHDIYTGLTYWSPNINIFRDPRWGRGQETYGEDPYLTARMGVAFVKGLQGDDPHYLKLVATPKHYAVHSGPEHDRHHFDARVSERDLRETYLPAFAATVNEAGACSVMGAYNRTNGEPCCASQTLLQRILRDEWGFQGYVVSDCGAIRDIYAHHRVVETPAEAAALAVKNGCDLNCGDIYPALSEAVVQGLIEEPVIDRALQRLFEARFRLGMFDPPERVSYAHIPFDVVNSSEHQALALEAARASSVLLKNEDDFLPLDRELAAIAVIGPYADDLDTLVGNYNGAPAHAVTPLEGIRRKVSPQTRVYYAPGCSLAEGVRRLVPAPSSALRPLNADAGQVGLTVSYYDGVTCGGDPVRVGVDATVNHSWKGVSPLTGVWGDRFAVRWEGYLIPPRTGAYDLGVRGYSQYTLFLDGELLAGYDSVHHPMTKTVSLDLEAGRLYRVQLDFVNYGLDPQVQLLWAAPEEDETGRALAAASKAEVVIMVLGLSPTLEGEEMPVDVPGFHGGDRTSIALPGPQAVLLRQVAALGKPVVLVLLSGSALAVNWADAKVPAIVQVWYPGEAGGLALADVLFGDYNPGGRLPVTFYRASDCLPAFEDYAMKGRTYRYFHGEVLYPFGHGLSYTTFDYRHLRIWPTTVGTADAITVSVELENSGDRAGDEVVQLYVSDVASSVPQPIQALKAFRRVRLMAGERRTLTFELPVQHLAFFDEAAGTWVVEPGAFEIRVGASAQDIRLAGTLTVTA